MRRYTVAVYRIEGNEEDAVWSADLPSATALMGAWLEIGKKVAEELRLLLASDDDVLDEIKIAAEPDLEIVILDDKTLDESLPVGLIPQSSSEESPSSDDVAWGRERHEMAIDTADCGPQNVVPGVEIYMRQEALRRADFHAQTDTTREVGGVLLGCFVRPGVSGPVRVVVTGIVRAELAVQEIARLNFTPEAWNDVLCRIDNDPLYSDETMWQVVGWYHTHPNFGAFYSSWDQAVHRQFTHPGHIGLVIDPLRSEHAYYCWNREQTRALEYKAADVVIQGDVELIQWLSQLEQRLTSLPTAEIGSSSLSHLGEASVDQLPVPPECRSSADGALTQTDETLSGRRTERAEATSEADSQESIPSDRLSSPEAMPDDDLGGKSGGLDDRR